MKSQKKYKNTIFIEDCGTYTNEVIVAIDSNFDEILRYVRRITGVNKENLKDLEESREDFKIASEKDLSGFVLKYRKGFNLLWMRPFTGEWDWYDTLIHECCHVTQNVLDRKMIRDDEAFAYLQEHLIRKIRRRLNAIYKSK